MTFAFVCITFSYIASMRRRNPMDNNKNIDEPQDKKVSLSLRMEPNIFGAVSKLAVAEDRSLTNMVERLLKQSPEVKAIIDGETAEAAA